MSASYHSRCCPSVSPLLSVSLKSSIARHAHYSLRFPPRALSVKADKHEGHFTAVRLLQHTQLIMWMGLHVIHTDDISNSRSIFGLVSLLRLPGG
jgi:hypothetical protein